jgi:hypothetical protein
MYGWSGLQKRFDSIRGTTRCDFLKLIRLAERAGMTILEVDCTIIQILVFIQTRGGEGDYDAKNDATA